MTELENAAEISAQATLPDSPEASKMLLAVEVGALRKKLAKALDTIEGFSATLLQRGTKITELEVKVAQQERSILGLVRERDEARAALESEKALNARVESELDRAFFVGPDPDAYVALRTELDETKALLRAINEAKTPASAEELGQAEMRAAVAEAQRDTAQRLNTYLLGETVYTIAQCEPGDVARDIVEALMERLSVPWFDLTEEQIALLSRAVPERLPRAILFMDDMNERLQAEAKRIAEVEAQRDARPAISREDAALVRIYKGPWAALNALEEIAVSAAAENVDRVLRAFAAGDAC